MENRLHMSASTNYLIPEEMSLRIDIYKVWLTIMVVFIHSYTETINFASGSLALEVPLWLETFKYVVSQSISRCAVPGFFMISSILLYRKEFIWRNLIKKKIRTLLIPYLILNTFWISFYFVCQHIPFLSEFFSNPDHIVRNWSFLDWLHAYGIFSVSPIAYHLWFLKYVFILHVLSVFIKRTIQAYPYASIAALMIIWITVDDQYSSILQAICFWGFGCFIVCKNINWASIRNLQRHRRSLSFAYFAFVFADTITRGSALNQIIHRASVVAGVAFWFICCTHFTSRRLTDIMLRLSTYSFGIYLFHEMNLFIFKKICAKIFPLTPVSQFLQYIFVSLIIIACCIVLCAMLKKHTPRLYSLLTGNR